MLGRITITRTFGTRASPAALWDALSAAPRWPEVLTDLAEARIEPDGVLAEGAVIRTVAVPGQAWSDMSYRVTAAEPRLSLAIEAEADGFRARTTQDIAPFPGGGRVTVTSEIEPVWWPHRFGVALSRRTFTDYFETMLEQRMRPMLRLAEAIQEGR